MKVIITGTTGMVGEGVLLECLANPEVTHVLSVSRRPIHTKHSKLKEYIVSDFLSLKESDENLQGYDACFFCAGVSSVGMKEEKYRKMTYDTTLSFAKALLAQNTGMVFTYVSGSHTDSSEKGRVMWARVKGKTENDLNHLGFKGEYNFRPGAMLPFAGQKNWSKAYRLIAKALKFFMPSSVLHMWEVGRAMINVAIDGYPKPILEIKDIKQVAGK